MSSHPALSTGQFDLWAAERSRIEAELARLHEGAEDARRDEQLNRLFEIEQLILTTPSSDISGVRAKARLLVWYMEMEQADGLTAIRDIREYLERAV